MSLYYVYILTNKTKTVLYIDSTDNIQEKISKNFKNEFVSKFKTEYLIYYKRYSSFKEANDAKFALRKCSRLKQDKEIKTMNPEFDFLVSVK